MGERAGQRGWLYGSRVPSNKCDSKGVVQGRHTAVLIVDLSIYRVETAFIFKQKPFFSLSPREHHVLCYARNSIWRNLYIRTVIVLSYALEFRIFNFYDIYFGIYNFYALDILKTAWNIYLNTIFENRYIILFD